MDDNKLMVFSQLGILDLPVEACMHRDTLNVSLSNLSAINAELRKAGSKLRRVAEEKAAGKGYKLNNVRSSIRNYKTADKDFGLCIILTAEMRIFK